MFTDHTNMKTVRERFVFFRLISWMCSMRAKRIHETMRTNTNRFSASALYLCSDCRHESRCFLKGTARFENKICKDSSGSDVGQQRLEVTLEAVQEIRRIFADLD